MKNWWDEVMAQGLKPKISINNVARSHIWKNDE